KRSPRKGKNRVAIALRMAAQALGRTMSPLGIFYRRIKSRIGGKGAVTAAAHKLACLVYRMLKYGTGYVKQSMEEYEQKIPKQQDARLEAKGARVVFQLTPHPAANAAGISHRLFVASIRRPRPGGKHLSSQFDEQHLRLERPGVRGPCRTYRGTNPNMLTCPCSPILRVHGDLFGPAPPTSNRRRQI